MSLFAEDSHNAPMDSAEEGAQITPQIMGHDAIETNLLTLFNNDKMPHGLIFSGIKGIGKASTARRLAEFLLSQPASNEPDMFGDMPPPPTTLDSNPDNNGVKLLRAGAHPDALIVERFYDEAKNKRKNALDVDQIRKIIPFLRKTSSDGGWRVIVIDDADTMNRNAQNALLKILEEPPKKTILILIAHRAGNLIPTIKSRAQTVNFMPLKDQTMGQLLSQQEEPPSENDKAILIDMACGSIGRALDLIEEEGIDTLQTISVLIKPPLNWEHIHKTTDSLSRAGQDSAYKSFETMLIAALRIMCQSKARNTPLPTYLSSLETLYTQKSLQELVTLSDSIDAHLNRSNFANLDKKSTLLQAISLIAK